MPPHISPASADGEDPSPHILSSWNLARTNNPLEQRDKRYDNITIIVACASSKPHALRTVWYKKNRSATAYIFELRFPLVLCQAVRGVVSRFSIFIRYRWVLVPSAEKFFKPPKYYNRSKRRGRMCGLRRWCIIIIILWYWSSVGSRRTSGTVVTRWSWRIVTTLSLLLGIIINIIIVDDAMLLQLLSLRYCFVHQLTDLATTGSQNRTRGE